MIPYRIVDPEPNEQRNLRSNSIRPRRIRIYYHVRMAQISQEFEKPFDAVIYCIRSCLNWPNGHALSLARHNLRMLKPNSFGSLRSKGA